MKMPMMRSLLIVVAVGATANASVWDRALTSPEDEAKRDLYDWTISFEDLKQPRPRQQSYLTLCTGSWSNGR